MAGSTEKFNWYWPIGFPLYGNLWCSCRKREITALDDTDEPLAPIQIYRRRGRVPIFPLLASRISDLGPHTSYPNNNDSFWTAERFLLLERQVHKAGGTGDPRIRSKVCFCGSMVPRNLRKYLPGRQAILDY